MLSVLIDPKHDVDAWSYLHGICGVFALALAEEYGYKIQMVRDASDAPGLANLCHVFCVIEDFPNPTMYIDARGLTDNKELFLHEFEEFLDNPVFENVNPDDLKRILINELGSMGYPFFLSRAKMLIRRYPSYYVSNEVDYILSQDNTKIGEIKNMKSRPCPIEGCTGMRMHVKWPDGKSTYPCTKGCTQISTHFWKIN